MNVSMRVVNIKPQQVVRRYQRMVQNAALYFAKELWNEVVDRTPVLTGALRGNWRATTNGRSPAEFDYSFKGFGPRHLPRQPRWNANRPGSTYQISNGAWYLEDIEYGKSSVKAPAGMVRVSVADVMSRNHPDLIAFDVDVDI